MEKALLSTPFSRSVLVKIMKLIFCFWLLYVTNSLAFQLPRWTRKTTYSQVSFDRPKSTKTSTSAVLPYRHGRASLPLHVALDPNMVQMFQQALWANGIQAAFLSRLPKVPLTQAGLLHATILGTGLMTFLGVEGWLVCVIYLVLGSLVTKIKMKEKEELGIAEKRGGKRGPENVWIPYSLLSQSRSYPLSPSLTRSPAVVSFSLYNIGMGFCCSCDGMCDHDLCVSCPCQRLVSSIYVFLR